MSRLLELRQGLASAIAGAGIGLAEDQVIVARSTDVFSEIEATVARSGKGLALVIAATSGDSIDARMPILTFEVGLNFSIWVKTIYHEDMPEEDVFEPLLALLSGATLKDGEGRPVGFCTDAIRVVGWSEIPDPEYLVWEIRTRVRMTFSDVVPVKPEPEESEEV